MFRFTGNQTIPSASPFPVPSPANAPTPASNNPPQAMESMAREMLGMKTQWERLLNENDRVKMELRNAREALDEQRSRATESEAKLMFAKRDGDRASQLREKNAELAAALSGMETAAQQWRERERQLADRMEGTRRELEETRARERDARSALETANRELENAKGANASLLEDAAKANAEAVASAAAREKAERKRDGYRAEAETWRPCAKEWKCMEEQARRRLEAKRADLQRCADENEALRAEGSIAREKLTILRQEADGKAKEAREWKARFDEATARSAKVENEAAASAAENQRLRDQMKSVMDAAEVINAKHTKLTAEATRLREEAKDLRENHSKLKGKLESTAKFVRESSSAK